MLVLGMFAGCGGSQTYGGYLTIALPTNNANVTIDDREPVQFSSLDFPILLEPRIHNVTVEYLDSGDIETKTINILHGYDYELEFTEYEEVDVSFYSPIPVSLRAGFVDVEVLQTANKAMVYRGEREISAELIGFGYRWRETRNFVNGSEIFLQPGADEEHGSLYIESNNKGTNIDTNIEDSPMEYEGSLFFPMVEPGVYELHDKYQSGVTHFVSIEAGKVTKLYYNSSFSDTGAKHTLKADPNSSIELTTLWKNGLVTVAKLGTGLSELSDYQIDKNNVFSISKTNNKGIATFIVSRRGGEIGVNSYTDKIPEVIGFEYNKAVSDIDLEKITKLKVSHFSPFSPDGYFSYVDQGIESIDGRYYTSISTFKPGCWDVENNRVLVTEVDKLGGALRARVAQLRGGSPLFYPDIILDDLANSENEYDIYNTFFVEGEKILAVYSNPKLIRLWSMDLDTVAPLYEFNTTMKISSLYSKKYLVCQATDSSYTDNFVIDVETGNISTPLPIASVSSDGYVLSGFIPETVSAGVIYKWDGSKLMPVWAGVFPSMKQP